MNIKIFLAWVLFFSVNILTACSDEDESNPGDKDVDQPSGLGFMKEKR